MSAVDQIITQFLTLETALFHAYARLAARTDGEALHDLRINLRRLRSLLHPLRGKQVSPNWKRSCQVSGS